MNVSVSQNSASTNDAIGSVDLIRVFARQWRWFVAVFVIVPLLSIALLSLIRPQWEAHATIRIGQIYDALSDTSRPVEPYQNAVERARVASFLEQALGRPSVAADDEAKRLLLSSATTELVTQAGWIRMSARGHSKQQAREFVRAMFDQLSSLHASIVARARSETEQMTAQLASELDSVRAEQSRLGRELASGGPPSASEAFSVRASIALAAERAARETRDLERKKFLLARQSDFQQYPTEIIGEIGSKRVGLPSGSLIVVFSLLIGLAAGVLVALLRDHLTRKKLFGESHAG